MAETSDPTPDAGETAVPDEVHEAAAEAATTTFRHHPGAWMDALPAALDTYRTVYDALAASKAQGST